MPIKFQPKAQAIWAIHTCYTTIVSSSDGGEWTSSSTCVVTGYGGGLPPGDGFRPYGSYGYLKTIHLDNIYNIGYYNDRVSLEDAIEYCHESNELLNNDCTNAVAIGTWVGATACATLSAGAAAFACVAAAGGMGLEAKYHCDYKKFERMKVCNDLNEL